MAIAGGEVFRTGWSRWLPSSLSVLYVKIAHGIPPSTNDLDGGLWDETPEDDPEQKALDAVAREHLSRLAETVNLEAVRSGADGLELMMRLGLIALHYGRLASR